MSKENTMCLKKFFTWKFKEFETAKLKEAEGFEDDDNRYSYGPVVSNFDCYNKIQRVAKFKIKLWKDKDVRNATFEVDITPPVICQNDYLSGKHRSERPGYTTLPWGKFEKFAFCVDIVVPAPPPIFLADKLMNMYMKDPTSKFIIKCQSESIEAIKPVLTACSPVFEAMFDSHMKEVQENSMEITDFEPEVVQKMIEFCENECIIDFDGLEEEVFKIAHKYQIPELMDYAVDEMVKTATDENHSDRYHMLANMSTKEEFKKWWSKL